MASFWTTFKGQTGVKPAVPPSLLCITAVAGVVSSAVDLNDLRAIVLILNRSACRGGRLWTLCRVRSFACGCCCDYTLEFWWRVVRDCL